MAELKEGDQAPDFSLPSSDGGTVSLKGLKGKSVVLYFYPKDDTPGCTKEACDFRALRKKFQTEGAEIYGVSFDNIDSHKKFITKYKLPFPLLSDSDKSVAQAYGVYKKKFLYGNSFLGIERTTFVIDPEGKIKKIFPKVKVDGHAEEVLDAVKS
ncbi:MAG TPA: thioredoxin-dependent thiol peroxidase [Candidatus Omnitrophota bacterium]|nr:thioredoxin-dependent thiol peroxidase [Candidatus Omnitrophota bacterium]